MYNPIREWLGKRREKQAAERAQRVIRQGITPSDHLAFDQRRRLLRRK